MNGCDACCILGKGVVQDIESINKEGEESLEVHKNNEKWESILNVDLCTSSELLVAGGSYNSAKQIPKPIIILKSMVILPSSFPHFGRDQMALGSNNPRAVRNQTL